MKSIQALLCNERIMLWAIVLNTIVMYVGGFWPNISLFEWSDALFTLIFIFEALAKIKAYGWKNYWQSGWNKFDFIVLLIALPSIVSPFLDHSMATNTILAMRSLRLFKSFKMLRFIPNIHKLLEGIKLALKASPLVLMAFAIFIIIFSILTSNPSRFSISAIFSANFPLSKHWKTRIFSLSPNEAIQHTTSPVRHTEVR